MGGGVKIHAVDDTLQERIFSGDGTHVGSDTFTDPVRQLADDRPDWLLGIVGDKRKIETNQLVVSPRKLECLLAQTDLSGNAVQLVVEDIAEALGKNKRENVVLVFRRILGTTNRTGSLPDPRFQGFPVTVIVCHQRLILFFSVYSSC